MTERLKNKKCFISAAAQGIGRASALAFAKEGADVFATDIAKEQLKSLKEESPSIRTQYLDVSKQDDIQRFFDEQDAFDVVFNCAGYVANGTILDCDGDDWRRSFTLNVDSMYFVCQAALPKILENGGASIINMSSVASSVIGAPNRFAYGATKGAVIGLTKSIAKDFVSKGVRCNAICPGTVMTPSLEERVKSLGSDIDANWKAFTDRQPMGRIGSVDEIAALVLYLASDESGFTTGTINVIDGGWAT